MSPLFGPGHWDIACIECHDMHGGTSNRKLIWEVIYTPNSGDRDVVFTNRIGPNSAADGDTVFDGVCEVCHTTSAYHRNDGTGDQTHHPGTQCIACHSHNNGFEPYPFDCLTCHSTPQPFEAGDYRRQVVRDSTGNGGDFVRASHHVSDGSMTEIVTAGDCIICHDLTDHGDFVDGLSLLLNDPKFGPSFLYDSTPDSLETFCVSCHDGSHGSLFSNGVPAPNIASQWTTSTHHTNGVTCGNCHGNGHGSDLEKLLLDAYSLSDSTAYDSAEYDLCWTCHSEQYVVFGVNQFEDIHKDHVTSSLAPCVMCHDNHGSYDEGEPGKVSFEYPLTNGMDIQMIDARDLSTSFWVSPDEATGFCYLRCHGRDHTPEEYERNFTHVGVANTTTFRPRIIAFPSPSHGPTTILVESPGAPGRSSVTASIFGVTGRKVRELRTETRGSGQTLIRWDGRDESGTRVGSGLYLCRVRTDAGVWNTRFVVLR
jgi:hypothetical protein